MTLIKFIIGTILTLYLTELAIKHIYKMPVQVITKNGKFIGKDFNITEDIQKAIKFHFYSIYAVWYLSQVQYKYHDPEWKLKRVQGLKISIGLEQETETK